MKNVFLESDVPYGKFAKLGISKEKYLSMPKEILEPLMSGKVTPLIQAHVRSRSGTEYAVPMKLQMMRNRDGKILLMTYPVRRDVVNDMRLNERELSSLRQGEVLRKEVNDNGVRRMQYIQLDRETKSLIKRNVSTLKLPEQMAQLEKIKDISLGQNQKDAIKEGKPVVLEVGDQKVTVGVDNKEPQGFKVVNGDMDEWKKQQMIRYDDSHVGFMGYVMTDKNRWEYQEVVNKLEAPYSLKTEQKKEQKEEHKMAGRLKM